MEAKNQWPVGFGDENITERDARLFVEKQKSMINALEAIEKFAGTGELPVVDNVSLTSNHMLIALENWDEYCEEEFGGENKAEMQEKLKQLRKQVEARISGSL